MGWHLYKLFYWCYMMLVVVTVNTRVMETAASGDDVLLRATYG
jgi:hypothetical protein